MTRSARGRETKRNKGWFKKGTDARRHIFTTQDCRIGWWVANILHPELREWLRMRLFCYYSRTQKEHTNGQTKNSRRAGTDGRLREPGDSCNAGLPAGSDDAIPF